MADWILQNLNEAQTEAITTTEGPLLVIAGAGSGKTRVITRRLAYILTRRLAEPYQILAVTFTNKAAGEMKERVTQVMRTDIQSLNISTFHSFGARFLRREAGALGYNTDFTIFDDADSRTLVKNCIKELGISDSQFPPKGQRRKISDAKNKMVSSEQFASQASTYFETRTAEIYKLYQKRLAECNGMDFDDLLCHTVALLSQNKEIGDRYRKRFKYLLVDEYQDTNRVQYLLLKNILGDHNNICVVGDEDQSIYGWRGADISNILNFEKDFAGAKVVKLERNYRSTSVILQAASSVIKNNEMRKEKTLYTDNTGGENIGLLLVDNAEEEACQVINLVEKRRDETSLKESAVLYRTNAQSRTFEEQLRRRGLPYHIIGGLGFYQRQEIKDLLAYLKLIANPKDDISFERIVNYPKRAIGGKTVADLIALARSNNVPCMKIASECEKHEVFGARAKRIRPFADLIQTYITRAETEPVDLITQDLVEELGLIKAVRDEDPATGQTRVENIEAFIEGAAEFARSHPEAKLNNYLSEISLFTDLDAYKEIEDKLTLMTIHSAKGLEFDAVYIAGLEEGLLPLDNSIGDPIKLEEERRLFYVGATRARKQLCLSAATARFRFGHVESIPSRFIGEIDESIIERFDRRTRRFADSARAVAPQATMNLGSGRYNNYGSPAKPKPKPAAPSGEYYEYEDSEIARVGRMVQHPTFGRGKIVKAEGFGDSLRLEILFSGLGIKKIMAKYAKLKIIG